MKQNKLTDAEVRFVKRAAKSRKSLIRRFPLLFGLMTTLGLVSVLYGFEKIIDEIDVFTNNPWILLVFGLMLLSITGAAYKKLN